MPIKKITLTAVEKVDKSERLKAIKNEKFNQNYSSNEAKPIPSYVNNYVNFFNLEKQW